MMRLSTVAVFLFFSLRVYCQVEKETKLYHAVYLEAGGAAIYGGLNYDFAYNPLKNIRVTTGIGFSKYSIGSWKYTYFLPKVNLLYSAKSFGGGIGITYAYSIYSFPRFLHPEYRSTLTRGFLFPHAHLRYQPINRNLYIGISGYAITRTGNASYFIRLDKATSHKYNFFDRDFVLWPGLSLGYTFPHKRQKPE